MNPDEIIDAGVTSTEEETKVEELVPEETLPENEAVQDTAEEVVAPADVEVPAEETEEVA
jgi:hypothetical protein